MTTITQRRRSAVSVDELKRAWQAVAAGEFRRGHLVRSEPQGPGPGPNTKPTPTAASTLQGSCSTWEAPPGETILPVLPCTDSLTAAAVALAIATASGTPARVIECGSSTGSDLAGASTAELGRHGPWIRGTRGTVLIDRVSTMLGTAAEVPVPADPDRVLQLTVLAAGWEFGHAAASSGWLGEAVRGAEHVVLATTATVPGLRRLETALDLLDAGQPVAAVLGSRRRKWDKAVAHSQGPLTRALDASGRLLDLPTDSDLAIRGLCSRPLPTSLTAAAEDLLQLVTSHNFERELS
ncbi:hypothetical protein GCM10011492_09710 [Flexivirga endophytica]|uniref:Uncharacterized protein n=1 Tax=Flexivirga endophytica TaxID=1849103 RepID=A0A916SX69_9MICO|nr:hypothetical protein GCM10011492_09710 [Flexivirga endophytica]GHB59485.1 hypothetical protein GCM10008112_30730 [Flexivirga endophytica]